VLGNAPRFSRRATSALRTSFPRAKRWRCALALREPLSFERRLDLIAEQVSIYGSQEPTKTVLAERWGRLVLGMRA
jgi:hypothetical protein